jgi:hypothetical protein
MVNVFHSFDLLPCFIVDFAVLIGHTCPFNRFILVVSEPTNASKSKLVPPWMHFTQGQKGGCFLWIVGPLDCSSRLTLLLSIYNDVMLCKDVSRQCHLY